MKNECRLDSGQQSEKSFMVIQDVPQLLPPLLCGWHDSL